MGNTNLHKAKSAAVDEFYTRLEDVEAELRFYKDHFKDKTVFLNADDPRESAFFEYFALNFNALGLKKLIAIGYEGSPVVGEQLPLFDMAGMKSRGKGLSGKQSHVVEISHIPDHDGKGATDLTDVDALLRSDIATVTPLEGDGDFRSDESIKYLQESDIVVTNPPFSLFREYVAQLIDHDKQFLILGNMNAVTYKEVFPLIKDNRMWLGVTRLGSGQMWFRVPDEFPVKTGQTLIDGVRHQTIGSTAWFTNLENPRRNAPLRLFRRYKEDPDAYPRYDNYDAIEVSRVADIPEDYTGIMGVPITFLGKHSPHQFRILGSQRWAKTPELLSVYIGDSIPPQSDKKTLVNGRETYDRIFITPVGSETYRDANDAVEALP